MTNIIVHKDLSNEEWLKLRTADITSTEVSALFDLNPYFTHYELWQRKAGKYDVEFESSDAMKLGLYLQEGIAKFYAEKFGWKIKPMEGVYIHAPELRIGASYDYEVICPVRGIGILEIKKVHHSVHRANWQDAEAPAHIELQVQTQMMMGNYQWGAIAILAGGETAEPLFRKPDLEMQADIKAAVKAFWQTIDAKQSPNPNFPDDNDIVIKMHQKVGGFSVDLSDSNELPLLINNYEAAREIEKEAALQKETAKAKILTIIGEASQAKCGAYNVSTTLIKAAEINAIRKPYRNFRITKKGEKNDSSESN